MLKMAAQHEAISVSAGAFDSDRMLLNCANGLVDLRTGDMLEQGPEHLVSKLAEVDYEPTAKCPTFKRFIDDLVSENIFNRRMTERGLKKTRTKAGMAYEDVAVASSTSTNF